SVKRFCFDSVASKPLGDRPGSCPLAVSGRRILQDQNPLSTPSVKPFSLPRDGVKPAAAAMRWRIIDPFAASSRGFQNDSGKLLLASLADVLRAQRNDELAIHYLAIHLNRTGTEQVPRSGGILHQAGTIEHGRLRQNRITYQHHLVNILGQLTILEAVTGRAMGIGS